MLFDQSGFFATTSYYSYQINIYTSNGSFTGNSFPTEYYSRYIDFDSKNRLIVSSYHQLKIYVKKETTKHNNTLLSNITANAY
jgi:hypothetical protein